MSTAVYLSALALADSADLLAGVVIQDVLASDISLGFDLRDAHIACCNLVEYVYFWAPQVSSWCLVAITLERLIVVIKPHR